MVRTHALLLRLSSRPASACWRHVLDRPTRFSPPRRTFTVLGIETSADDTCVALLEMKSKDTDCDSARLLHLNKVTCPNQNHRGIHPVEAVASHTKNLSRMVSESLLGRVKPDLISVTRGPGMGSCLSVGVTTAKALSDNWRVPVIGVHHMQAHALTPLMEAALRVDQGIDCKPFHFPALTLLVSGKHTMLVHTKSQVHHRILASVEGSSPALGDVMDKIARDLVPPELIPSDKPDMAVCYPKLMEEFAKDQTEQLRGAKVPDVYHSVHGWKLTAPLRGRPGLTYNFSGISGQVRRILAERPDMSETERRELAAHTMRIAFEHLMTRVFIALDTDEDLQRDPPKTFVLSGGVASNGYLRNMVKVMLQNRSNGISLALAFPQRKWCTDNAAMVAFAGYKMYKDGWQTDAALTPIVKWSIEEILTGVDGWVRRPGFPPITPENVQTEPASVTPEDEQKEPPPVANEQQQLDEFDLAFQQLLIDGDNVLKKLEAEAHGTPTHKNPNEVMHKDTHKDSHEDAHAEVPEASEAATIPRETEGSAVAPPRQGAFMKWWHGQGSTAANAATATDSGSAPTPDLLAAPTHTPESDTPLTTRNGEITGPLIGMDQQGHQGDDQSPTLLAQEHEAETQDLLRSYYNLRSRHPNPRSLRRIRKDMPLRGLRRLVGRLEERDRKRFALLPDMAAAALNEDVPRPAPTAVASKIPDDHTMSRPALPRVGKHGEIMGKLVCRELRGHYAVSRTRDDTAEKNHHRTVPVVEQVPDAMSERQIKRAAPSHAAAAPEADVPRPEPASRALPSSAARAPRGLKPDAPPTPLAADAAEASAPVQDPDDLASGPAAAPGAAEPAAEEKRAPPPPRKDTSRPAYHAKVWPVAPTERERAAVKVRFLGFGEEPACKKAPSSLAGRIASVLGGWLRQK